MKEIFHHGKFIHQFFIDMQTACCIVDHGIKAVFLCILICRFCGIKCRSFSSQSKDWNLNRFTKSLQLFNRSRTNYVTGNQQYFFVLLILQVTGNFSCSCCFTSSLKTSHHNIGDSVIVKMNFSVFISKKLLKFFLNDFDNHLSWIQSIKNFLS